MAALISAVLFAGLRSCCFADITPSYPSTSPRKPRSWPWLQTSPPDSHSPAAPKGIAGNRRPLTTSVVFPVYGNVYPDGFYYVSMNIGDPPKPSFLDMDTGSDVTWLRCDAPCVKCSQASIDISTEISKAKPMLKEAVEEKALPHCWKGTRPIKSVFDLRKHFRSLNFSFTNGKTPAVLDIPPEKYFIVTKQGNACLGILNGGEVGLGDLNLVGDISM